MSVIKHTTRVVLSVKCWGIECENLQHDNWFVELSRADFQVFVLDYKWQVLIPGKTENFSCLKEDAQLRKQWQKFGIKKILAVRGVCTSSYVPVKV